MRCLLMIYEIYLYFSNAQQTCAYTPKLDVFGKVYSGYTLVRCKRKRQHRNQKTDRQKNEILTLKQIRNKVTND